MGRRMAEKDLEILTNGSVQRAYGQKNGRKSLESST